MTSATQVDRRRYEIRPPWLWCDRTIEAFTKMQEFFLAEPIPVWAGAAPPRNRAAPINPNGRCCGVAGITCRTMAALPPTFSAPDPRGPRASARHGLTRQSRNAGWRGHGSSLEQLPSRRARAPSGTVAGSTSNCHATVTLDPYCLAVTLTEGVLEINPTGAGP